MFEFECVGGCGEQYTADGTTVMCMVGHEPIVYVPSSDDLMVAVDFHSRKSFAAIREVK